MTTQAAYFTITSERTNAIADLVCEAGVDMTAGEVFETCTADWAEGAEHQAWLDTASVADIAEWVLSVNA